MSTPLTDQEILELNELCGALADESITDVQRQRLEQLLETNEEARRYYVRAMGLSASLHTYAAETQTEPVTRPREVPVRARRNIFSWWHALPVAGAIAAAMIYIATLPSRNPENEIQNPTSPDSIASITGATDCVWGDGNFAPGDRVPKGRQLHLERGIAEITFDSGARLTLEAPAILEANSAWDSTLRRGLVKASVPTQAIGFRIASKAVDVIDLGTEFTMDADADGTAAVRVLKGEIEASPRGADRDTLYMRENETLRFAADGITTLDSADPAYIRLNLDLNIEHTLPGATHYRVTFDDSGNAEFPLGPTTPSVAQIRNPIIHAAASDTPAAMYSDSKHGRALRLDGDRYAQVNIPNLSSHAAHTIAFWAKIPKDTTLANSYAMIGWSTALPKLNSRPVHISWNRTPGEGTLGAIRTDFGGGHAIGNTNLRDGRWHHIAIIFTPGENNTPVEVRQYVDGRLESGAITPDQFRATGRAADASAPLLDTLWLGCRLGASGPRKERFRGEIAEVHITERGLTPFEIVSLMQANHLE